MALLEKQLTVKKSTIPGAGKGLFTQNQYPREHVLLSTEANPPPGKR